MNRQSGSLLIEMMIALVILTVGLLGFFASFAANFRAGEEVTDRDDVRAGMENVIEVLRGANFNNLYTDYDGATFEVPYLEASGSPSNATVQVTFFVNELALPAEFGPIMDLDGFGGLGTADCSATYKLLPARLSLTYGTSYGSETRDLFLVMRNNN